MNWYDIIFIECDNMNYIIDRYNEDKLLIRAVDLPPLHKVNDEIKYDCSIWANEFAMIMNDDFESVSSTLLIPNVGVRTYKNVGFLVNSDFAGIQHIALSDSGSSGSFKNGDFNANQSDFETLNQLASYIKNNNHTTMNEVNISIPLNSVVGLVVVKCGNELKHLKAMLAVRDCIYKLTGIQFDIFEYDSNFGKIEQIDLTDELIEIINSTSNVNKYDYYTDYSDEIYEGSINNRGRIM
jgi:hypothetical protein